MRHSIPKFLITAILFCFALSVKAQTEDYVITSKGDTIHCKVSTSMVGLGKYKSPEMGDAVKITIEDIKEFYIKRKDDRERAVAVEDRDQPFFMKVMENGPINLYQHIVFEYSSGPAGTHSTTVWYISKGLGVASPLKSANVFLGKSRKDRKDELAEMLQDKQDVYNKYLEENSFSFNKVQKIVHYYNTGEWKK